MGGFTPQPGYDTRGGAAQWGRWNAQKPRSSGVIGRSMDFAASSSFPAGTSFSNPSNEATASIHRRSVSMAASGGFLPGGIFGFV
ncbi:MAG: hypothetical protein J2P21_09165 [Chloracidobacterium sp.]|nr:hypothetical protein [Chloracidobacterium sp.]